MERLIDNTPGIHDCINKNNILIKLFIFRIFISKIKNYYIFKIVIPAESILKPSKS